MRDNHRHGRLVRGLRIGLVPLCLGMPGAALGQSFSAGDLASSRAPSMLAAPDGYGDNGVGSLLPNLFDQFAITLGLSERYTDNATGFGAGGGVFGGGGIGAQANWVTQGLMGVSASSITRRLSVMLNYTLNVNYFANSVGGNQSFLITNYLNAATTMDVIENHFLVQAQAFATPVYASRLGNILPGGQALPPGANGDVRDSYGYVIQPDFYFKLGDFLRSDLVPSYSAFYYSTQAGGGGSPQGTQVASNQTTRAVTERLTGGEFFTRVRWGAIAAYSEMGNSSFGLTQRSASGELSYAIDHGFSILGNVGYQAITAQTTFRDKLSGAIYMGGMRFNLARLSGEFRAGEQFNSFSMTGNLSYELTPRTRIYATAQDGVNTPGGALFNPQALGGSLTQGFGGGQLQVPGGGIGLGGLNGVVGLQNSIARFRSQTIGANYSYEDYLFNLSGYNTVQETQTPVPTGQDNDLRSTGVMASMSKAFTPELTGNAYTTFRNDNLVFGGGNTMEVGAGASYALVHNTQVYSQVTYFKRFSNTALTSVGGGDVSAVSILVGITHTIP